MRVDFDRLLIDIKGTELYEYFHEISLLDKYTLLNPPYEAKDVKELARRAQTLLNTRLPNSYFWFLKCCDGGLLFTNQIYSILAPDDDEDDLVYVNTYLREEERIPNGSVAIGTTNYGAYIVLVASGSDKMALWDPEEGAYIAEYDNLYMWLEDVIKEARFLLENDGLPEIFEPEDDDVE